MFRTLTAAALALTLSSPLAAGAEPWSLVDDDASFRTVADKSTFLDIVTQGRLKRFGITLKVRPDGKIDGSAFGRKISGRWEWQDRFFCRDLYWGSSEIGANCQEVKVSGNTVRFTSDEGQGRYADLVLR